MLEVWSEHRRPIRAHGIVLEDCVYFQQDCRRVEGDDPNWAEVDEVLVFVLVNFDVRLQGASSKLLHGYYDLAIISPSQLSQVNLILHFLTAAGNDVDGLEADGVESVVVDPLRNFFLARYPDSTR